MTMEQMLQMYPNWEGRRDLELRLAVLNVDESLSEAVAFDRSEISGDSEDGEEKGLMSYLDDVYDVKFTCSIVDGKLVYEGVRAAVALGGPSIYVNTNNNSIEGFWGFTESFSWGLDSDICNEIDEIFEELFNAYR